MASSRAGGRVRGGGGSDGRGRAGERTAFFHLVDSRRNVHSRYEVLSALICTSESPSGGGLELAKTDNVRRHDCYRQTTWDAG